MREALSVSGRGRALDGRLDCSNRSRLGREPGARVPRLRKREREREWVKERGRRGGEKERQTEKGGRDSRSPRRAAFAKQLLRNRCLDDTRSRMRARNAGRTRATVKSARASRLRHPCLHITAVSTTTSTITTTANTTPPPSSSTLPPPVLNTTTLASSRKQTLLSFSLSLSHHFSLRPHPRGVVAANTRTRASTR